MAMAEGCGGNAPRPKPLSCRTFATIARPLSLRMGRASLFVQQPEVSEGRWVSTHT